MHDAISISRVCDLYTRAPELGLSEGQAHYLAELLARFPASRLEFEDGLLTVLRPTGTGPCAALASVPARMPFEGADQDRDLA